MVALVAEAQSLVIFLHGGLLRTLLADTPHIRLRASEERANHNLGDGTDTPKRCQSPGRAQWTTCWRGDRAISRFGKGVFGVFPSGHLPVAHAPYGRPLRGI